MEKPTINSSEIVHTEEVGTLNNSPVRLIKCKGGFWLAVGRPKGKHKEEALAAGSHSAIVKFNIEKQYPDFQPNMMKSENFSDSTIVDKHSHFLENEMRKNGHDLYSIQTGNHIDFIITKHQTSLIKIEALIENNALVIKDLNAPAQFSKALAKATTEKAIGCNIGKLRIENK